MTTPFSGAQLQNALINDTPSATIAQIQAMLNSHGVNGTAYASFAHANPTLTPYQAAQVWITQMGLNNAIGNAVIGTGTATGQIAQGTVSGLNNFSKDVLGGFNIGSWFMRIGEILLGLVLIGVGIARITGAQNVVSKVVKAKIP